MLKDLTYALELARDAGLELQSAGTVKRLLEETISLGFADAYHTAVIEAVRKHRS
jgi:3-hydroxyisobutyrate dehydrogenase-like beta-hydroxyacid dehydrogenase